VCKKKNRFLKRAPSDGESKGKGGVIGRKDTSRLGTEAGSPVRKKRQDQNQIAIRFRESFRKKKKRKNQSIRALAGKQPSQAT